MTPSQKDLLRTYPLFPTNKSHIFDLKKTIQIILSKMKAMNPLTKSHIKTSLNINTNNQYHTHNHYHHLKLFYKKLII